MFCPHSIPLNSFSVSTMAKSSISVTLYFCCVWESFLLKNTIGCRVKELQLETGCPLRRLFEVKLQNYSSAKLLNLQNYDAQK
jgi:hypothetical protein